MNWILPESVPNCVSSRLKTISSKGLKGAGCFGDLDEMEVTKYLLKNSRVLEKMTIYTPGLYRLYPPGHGLHTGTTQELYDEISKSELGSRTVQVELFQKMFFDA